MVFGVGSTEGCGLVCGGDDARAPGRCGGTHAALTLEQMRHEAAAVVRDESGVFADTDAELTQEVVIEACRTAIPPLVMRREDRAVACIRADELVAS